MWNVLEIYGKGREIFADKKNPMNNVCTAVFNVCLSLERFGTYSTVHTILKLLPLKTITAIM